MCAEGGEVNLILMPYLDCPEYTRAAVEDCLQQTKESHLLLIDNGSRDPGRMLGDELAQHPSGRVLRWRHDPPLPALSAVWNTALRFAWEAGADRAFVVNNDVRLHRDTFEVLSEVMDRTHAWFVTGVSVREGQYDPDLDLRAGLGEVTDSRRDGVRPEGYTYGGPDFSCFVIAKACHQWFQFDEGFIPAYHEDNDYHRRLKLAGFGEKIFGVNVPFLHYGSGTLNSNPTLREGWAPKFAACQAYYQRKWGGMPGTEVYQTPFQPELDPPPAMGDDLRYTMTGQGKPPYMEGTAALFGEGV